MKSKISYRYVLLIKVVSLLILGFLLINVVMWLFFRNEVRNIGYYLYYGKKDDAVLLIAEYIGDPPSRFKSRILVQSFGLTVVYRDDREIIWAIEKWGGRFFRRNIGFQRGHMMMGRMMMGGMGEMMNKKVIWNVYLSKNRILSIYLPMHSRKGSLFIPFFFFFTVIAVIGLIIFLFVKKTLKPLDRIMEAAERIGAGDLTHRLKYNRHDDFGKVAVAFNTMAEKLSSMLSNQRELLHFISHELRTPLARINLALELRDKKSSDEIIKDEIHEIDALVDKVLELSRMDYEDRERTRKSIDLVSSITDLTAKFKGENIQFNREVSDARISGNDVLIHKALSNLIDNAVKYSARKSPIIIELREGADSYTITIENSGPGIPPEEMDKIWEPFFRGGNSGLDGAEGKGLGLVIVKKAVRLSSGEISVKSSADGPTVFTVTFPRNP